ncbi:MAG: NADH:flavin oxidoreductase [Pseudomonadota bacterium]
MKGLFEKSEICGMTLANRFVRSATWEGMAAEDGTVTPKLTETMTALAAGGVGLIITSHAYVRRDGQASPRQLGICRDELVPGLRKMTEAVHLNGGKMVVQLAHAGHFAPELLIGRSPLAVSVFSGLTDAPRKEITTEDIHAIVADYADAALRAKNAGFDGVEIHGAHGYLLSQFLSSAFNRRGDEYGGDIRNRVRIHVDICKAIRKAVGMDYPILIKLNGRDFIENGLELEESMQAAGLLAEAGFDAIELSGGTITSGKLSPNRSKIDSEDKEAYFREEARAIKKTIHIPLILVGGIRSLEVAGRLVEEGLADYISMSRPFIREPGLINRWRSGDRRRATCISDNLCFRPGFNGRGIYCVTEEREQK